MPFTDDFFETWLDSYRKARADLIEGDVAFAAWLATDYVPVAGAWLY